MNNEGSLLQKLRKHFFRGSLNFLLHPEDVALMSWDWQQQFLDATLNNNLIKKYPISTQSMRLFLKKLTESLEGHQEIHDEFYLNLCSAMNNVTSDSFCYRHYLINYKQHEIITLKETNKMVVNGTTGMRTWEAALMLADWALCHKEVFANKTILELGSGVGFTGITVGKLCKPKCIYLTDCHPEVMKTICDNININFPSSIVEEIKDTTLFKNTDMSIGAMPLDWNSLEDIPIDILPDVLIGADIVYDPVILEPLCHVLKSFLERNSQLEIYIASVIRNEDTFQAFLRSLDTMNFTYEKLSLVKNTYVDWDDTIEKFLLKIKCM